MVNNLSNLFLTKHEIEILKLGLSFTQTPKNNISELKTDIYNILIQLMKTSQLLKIHLHLHQKLMKIKNWKPYARNCQK